MEKWNIKMGIFMMEYNNGDKYDGYIRNDLKDGNGKMEYKNGNIYDGIWINDLKEGKGIMKQEIIMLEIGKMIKKKDME